MGIANMCIDNYVENIVINCGNPFLINPHFEKQYESFYFNDNSLVNDLFKMENSESIIKLYKKLNINSDALNHLNKTNHNHKLSDNSINILKKIYANDLLHLNYNE